MGSIAIQVPLAECAVSIVAELYARKTVVDDERLADELRELAGDESLRADDATRSERNSNSTGADAELEGTFYVDSFGWERVVDTPTSEARLVS